MIIEKDDSTEAWIIALREAKQSTVCFIDENGNECHEIIGMNIKILNPETVTNPLIAMRSMGPWHYPSNEELKDIILEEKKPGFNYTYGSRIFSYNGMNQIEEFIIPLLLKEPNSRRAIVNLWNPLIDSNHKKRNVPGLITLDFKLRNNKLHVTGTIRSADLLFGWPANIFQISLMQEKVSKRLHCEKGTISTFMTSAHIFTYQNDYIDELIRLYTKISH